MKILMLLWRKCNFFNATFQSLHSGKSYTMLGRPDSSATVGAIPCAISWLFRGIAEQRHKCGTRFSVRVSAVELCTNTNQIRDLLATYHNGETRKNITKYLWQSYCRFTALFRRKIYSIVNLYQIRSNHRESICETTPYSELIFKTNQNSECTAPKRQHSTLTLPSQPGQERRAKTAIFFTLFTYTNTALEEKELVSCPIIF